MSSWMRARVGEGTEVALLIAVDELGTGTERLEVTHEGAPAPVREETDVHGNRVHRVGPLGAGGLIVTYSAREVPPAPVPAVGPTDAARYLSASRYCEVGEFGDVAAGIVGDRTGIAAAHAVGEWVHEHLSYVPGSSTITDSARSTYAARRGVCRDYAHLTATLLRAGGIPARCTAVYAPGLSPMDFHLVVEALVDGAWTVVDATRLAPRSSLVRVASGRDAADTAFMTTLRGSVTLEAITVGAVVDPVLPVEDPTAAVPLR